MNLKREENDVDGYKKQKDNVKQWLCGLIILVQLLCSSISKAGQINTDLNIRLGEIENKKINKHIKKYKLDNTLKKRYLQNILLFQKIKNKLFLNNLPKDFAYIIIVESKFNPLSNSKNKYRGIWQLNTYIGRKFGGIKSTELHDPIKSTNIAINYLLYLQKQFNNNHNLMLYAYNFGETKIKKLMKIYGVNIPRDKLPFITRNYFPSMLAAKYVTKQWEKDHNENEQQQK